VQFPIGAVLQHSDTPSLRVAGFEDDDENEAPHGTLPRKTKPRVKTWAESYYPFRGTDEYRLVPLPLKRTGGAGPPSTAFPPDSARFGVASLLRLRRYRLLSWAVLFTILLDAQELDFKNQCRPGFDVFTLALIAVG
jgi:hypothetical protein